MLNIIELDVVSFSLFDLPPVKEYDLYMSSFGRTNAQQVTIAVIGVFITRVW